MTDNDAGSPAARLRLGVFENLVSKRLDSLVEGRFIERLFQKDPTLWKTGEEERKLISNALGWLDLPETMAGKVDEINGFAAEAKKEGFTHAVLLGMGGSSLAPLVMARTFGRRRGWPELIVLDSTDPDSITRLDRAVLARGARPLFIVSSKSGSTIEPLTFFEYFHSRVKAPLGALTGGSFIAITDPGSRLEAVARDFGFRRIFSTPADVGGRFSALTYFGLVPAALSGIEIRPLLDSARVMRDKIIGDRGAGNEALRLGAALGELALLGRDKVTFFCSGKASSFGLWAEQLIAESTGKENKGLVPVAGEPPLDAASYGSDRVFVHIGVGGPKAALASRLDKYHAAGHPVVETELQGPFALGAEFFRWEAATAVAGAVIAINPFDQPDVELAKMMARERLAPGGAKKAAAGPASVVTVRSGAMEARLGGVAMPARKGGRDRVREALRALFDSVNGGDYVGLLAYVDTFDPAVEGLLEEIRKTVLKAGRSAAQLGFGPRYLHSTGQLHKGGANNGVFLLITRPPSRKVRIPGRPFDFGRLEASQAQGDMDALLSRGRRVLLVNIGKGSCAAGLKRLLAAVKGALK